MHVDDYSFGSMTVDGKIYNTDLIIFPETIKPDWWRKKGHSLTLEDLEEILKYNPEVLIVGKGYSGCMQVSMDTKKALQYQNIQVIDKNTGEAYKVFNDQIKQGKKVVGAFHLTC